MEKKQLWSKILKYIGSNRKNLIAMIILVSLCGILETSFPFIFGWFIGDVEVNGNLDNLLPFLGIVALLIAGQIGTVYWFIYNAGKVESGWAYELRKRGFYKLQKLSLSFFDKNPTGITMSKLTGDVGKVTSSITWGIVDWSWGGVMMVTMAIAMFIYNWKLALYTLAIMPVLFIGGFLFQKAIINKHRAVRKLNGFIIAGFNEGIMGARTVKTLGQEDSSLDEFRVKSTNIKAKAIRAGILGAIFFPFVGVLASVGTAMALWKGASFEFLGEVDFKLLTTFIFCSGHFFIPIYEMSYHFANFQSARAAAERIVELLDTEEEIIDCAEDKTGEVEKVKGDIRFENVSFEYVEGETVLDNFSIDIKKGESIALVGETGSGKSTIVNLACRFYEPTSGKIFIDGKDYREITQRQLHSSLGYVLQSPYLFNDSIRENVRFGRLDATDEEITSACKEVGAHEFILELENGYDTKAGESGKMLSTGQKQLISLARAILADPSIFVLDEATSSVDAESEVKIQRAVDKILHGRTSFVIAHRLSTVVHSDRILVIEKGRVIEMGSHSELLEKQGHYHRLYTNQFFQEREAALLTEK